MQTYLKFCLQMLVPIILKQECTGSSPHTKHQATSKKLRRPTAPSHPQVQPKDRVMKQPTYFSFIFLGVRGHQAVAQSTDTLARTSLLGLFFIKFPKPVSVVQESTSAESRGFSLLHKTALSYR